VSSRRTSKKLVVAALVLVCTAVYAGMRGDASAVTNGQQGPQRVREITESRTISSKTYELADGAREWVGYGEAVHYVDGNGDLQDIDNSIVTEHQQIDGTDHIYRNASNEYKACFAAKAGGEDVVNIEFQGKSIAFGPVATTSSSATKTSEFASKALSDMAYAQNCVAYREIYPGIDLLYQAKTYGVEEYLVLKGPKAQNEFTFNLTLRGLSVDQADGRISFVDDQGNAVFWLGEPLAVDDAGAMTKDVTYSLSGGGSTCRLKVTLSRMYLDDAKRAFPVVLDPSVLITGNANTYDTYTSSYNPGTNYVYNTYLRTGMDTPYGIRRTYLRFDLSQASGIDPGDVTDAYIRLEKYSGVTPQVRAYRSLDAWSSGSITWNNAPAWPSRYDQSYPSTQATNDSGNWWTMHCTTTVRLWLGGVVPERGWMIKDSRETNTSIWTTFYACDAPSPHKPELHIVYYDSSDPGCTAVDTDPWTYGGMTCAAGGDAGNRNNQVDPVNIVFYGSPSSNSWGTVSNAIIEIVAHRHWSEVGGMTIGSEQHVHIDASHHGGSASVPVSMDYVQMGSSPVLTDTKEHTRLFGSTFKCTDTYGWFTLADAHYEYWCWSHRTHHIFAGSTVGTSGYELAEAWMYEDFMSSGLHFYQVKDLGNYRLISDNHGGFSLNSGFAHYIDLSE
jgi:hypothetical protein